MKNVLRQIKKRIHRATAPNPVPPSPPVAEADRLSGLPRYLETTTQFLGFPVVIPDGPSFMAVWKEVFENGIYHFASTTPTPRILDCGANIGLSCLFFKRLYPTCKITAFEPDPKIFQYLGNLISGAQLTDVELVPRGVWSSATTLRFSSEGSDAGRIETAAEARNVIEIQTVRLKDYLSERTDFLKIDIEGAETEVLIDCADSLGNVENLFVEYHSFAGKPQTLDQILSVLGGAGFRVQIHPVLISQKPFLEVKNYLGMDLQLNIFGYRGQGKCR